MTSILVLAALALGVDALDSVQDPCAPSASGAVRESHAWLNHELVRRGHRRDLVCAPEFTGMNNPQWETASSRLSPGDPGRIDRMLTEKLQLLREMMTHSAAGAEVAMSVLEPPTLIVTPVPSPPAARPQGAR